MFRLVQSFFIPPVREIFPKDLYISWQHFVVLQEKYLFPSDQQSIRSTPIKHFVLLSLISVLLGLWHC
jgi:hypothetical protein